MPNIQLKDVYLHGKIELTPQQVLNVREWVHVLLTTKLTKTCDFLKVDCRILGDESTTRGCCTLGVFATEVKKVKWNKRYRRLSEPFFTFTFEGREHNCDLPYSWIPDELQQIIVAANDGRRCSSLHKWGLGREVSYFHKHSFEEIARWLAREFLQESVC